MPKQQIIVCRAGNITENELTLHTRKKKFKLKAESN